MESVFAVLLSFAAYGIPPILMPANSNFALVVTIIMITASVFATYMLGFRALILYLVILLMGQNFLAGMWFTDADGTIPLYVTESKTLALAVAMVLLIRPIIRVLARHRRLLAIAGLYVSTVLLHVQSLDPASLAYLRNFLSPIAILLLGLACSSQASKRERRQFLNSLSTLAAAFLLTGSLLEIVVGTTRWRSFLNADSSGALGSLSEYTAAFGLSFPRIGGFIVEPTNAGYLGATVALAGLLNRTWRSEVDVPSRINWFVVFAGLTVVALAAAKNGFLLLAIAFIFLALRSAKTPVNLAAFLSWGITFVSISAYIGIAKGFSPLMASFGNPVGIVGGESTTFHFAGLLYGIKHAVTHVLGQGIGSGGNFNRETDQTRLEWLTSGSESTWGVIAFQAGLFGLIFWLLWVVVSAKTLGTRSAAVIVAWSAVAMFAEAMPGPQIAGLTMFTVALFAEHESTSPTFNNQLSPREKHENYWKGL